LTDRNYLDYFDRVFDISSSLKRIETPGWEQPENVWDGQTAQDPRSSLVKPATW
jgi:hypothetical protein